MKLKALIGAYVLYLLAHWGYTKVRQLSKRRIAQALRKARDAQHVDIPEVPEAIQQHVLSLTVTELAAAIRSGQVTSVQATATYIRRAYTLGRSLELTAEEPFAQALALAAERDEALAANPSACGPMHGVPVSIKDHIGQRGCHSSSGVVSKAVTADTHDAALLQQLLAAGAVPFVRSNVPQVMLWIESENHIYGCAKNPWNERNTPGGSSGGEGGLVAGRLSPLGIGSDVGGSIRVPSAFCGVYGFKPTTGRVSGMNVKDNTLDNYYDMFFRFIPVACGPLGKCAADIELALQVLFGPARGDNFALPLHFDRRLKPKTTMRIGYFTNLALFEPSAAVKRGVLECKAALEAQGHTLLEFKLDDPTLATKLFLKSFNAQGLDPLLNALDGEEPMYFYAPAVAINSKPWLRDSVLWLLKKLGNTRLYDFLNVPLRLSAKEMKAHNQAVLDFIGAITAQWQALDLDAVVCPVLGIVSPNHTKTLKALTSGEYCYLWKLLRYPTGVVPVSQVLPGEDLYESAIKDLVSSDAKEACKDTVGMPIAVQVVGLPHQDEKVVEVMKTLEATFKFQKHPL